MSIQRPKSKSTASTTQTSSRFFFFFPQAENIQEVKEITLPFITVEKKQISTRATLLIVTMPIILQRDSVTLSIN